MMQDSVGPFRSHCTLAKVGIAGDSSDLIFFTYSCVSLAENKILVRAPTEPPNVLLDLG